MKYHLVIFNDSEYEAFQDATHVGARAIEADRSSWPIKKYRSFLSALRKVVYPRPLWENVASLRAASLICKRALAELEERKT